MHTTKVLDHGFVTLRNIAGPTRRTLQNYDISQPEDIECDFDAEDVDPANAARMSFNQMDGETITDADGTVRPRVRADDLKLCKFLMKNWHTSPFEMIECWIEMKLPIFVARQFVRHRTVSINEVSGRYVTLPAEWYIPEVVGAKPDKAKQGQVDTLSATQQAGFNCFLNAHCENGYAHYSDAIQMGVAPEHARLFLSLNHYTHWLWKQDLHNMMHFLSLRDHSHAQIEAQAYAKAIDAHIRRVLPNCMALYDEYRKR